MKSIATRIHKLSPGRKASAQFLFAVVLFIGGALLENRLQLIFDTDPTKVLSGIFWMIGVLLLGLLWAVTYYTYQLRLQRETETSELQQRSIQTARERVAELHLSLLERCDLLVEKKGHPTLEEFRHALICDQVRLNDIVESIWSVVDSFHNVSALSTERVNFEVSLITKSHQHEHLTVAAWKNRDNRRPNSLAMQNNGQLDIYNDSEADKLLKTSMPVTKVIPDTSVPEANYKQMYPDQKSRVKSTVLHPIISPANKRLGVLVLHCERPNFFKQEDRRYWEEFFWIFAPAVALELERIDAYNHMANAWTEQVRFSPYVPF